MSTEDDGQEDYGDQELHEDQEDELLVGFFNSYPGLDKYYNLFDQETFSSFMQIPAADIRQRLGPHMTNVDEITGFIIGCRSEYANDQENDDDHGTTEAVSGNPNQGEVLNTDSYVKQRIFIQINTVTMLKSCLLSKRPLCLSCVFNQGHDISEFTPKLCERLLFRKKSSVVQVKPFPIAHFILVVNDKILLNRIKTFGIKCCTVRKEVGAVIFDFLKSIFP